MAPASQGLLGRIQRANDNAAHRFGPHTAEVEAFIEAAGSLTPWQWRQVLGTRRLVGSVTKDGTDHPSARTIQAEIRSAESRLSEQLARAGEVLFDVLSRKGEEKQVTAWQAMSALVGRSQMTALKFAVHYAPFAAFIPLAGSEVIDPRTRRFIATLARLTRDQYEVLAHRWHVEPEASRALLRVVARTPHLLSEEAVAVASLTIVPNHLQGDGGWSAIRTAVHGGRVLGCAEELTGTELSALWAPLEPVVPLASLDLAADEDTGARVKAVVSGALRTIRRPRSARTGAVDSPPPPAPYGPNSAEVAGFIKAVAELSPIQWLRVLDRRKLVASVTREGSAEPAGVVRSLLAAIHGTRELDLYTRCRAFAAVEGAGHAIGAEGHLSEAQIVALWSPFERFIRASDVNAGSFAHLVASLDKHDWEQVAAASPPANEEAVAPLVNAGAALVDFFGGRSDDEAVATWHAVAAVVRRRQLTPIKFAASYAPFASAIPVTNPRALGAMVSRYVTAVGRLGASQCAALAQPWQLPEELSSALSAAAADGSGRAGEEAAALAAVVTVPMRLATEGGWAAIKTAAYGGRVIAVRTRLAREQLEALWTPLQAAIPLGSLSVPAKTRRQ